MATLELEPEMAPPAANENENRIYKRSHSEENIDVDKILKKKSTGQRSPQNKFQQKDK